MEKLSALPYLGLRSGYMLPGTENSSLLASHVEGQQ